MNKYTGTAERIYSYCINYFLTFYAVSGVAPMHDFSTDSDDQ